MLKILLIEDEFIIAKDIKTFLGKNNYALVDIVKNFNSAIIMYQKNDYDLIISDINLNSEKTALR